MEDMVTSTSFENSGEVYKWLSRFVNLERGQSKKSFNLERIKILAEAAGAPEKCAPAIHVAGSKGKGSVTGMAAAVIEAHGIKTARYASPHVNDFRERLLVGGGFFDEEIYVRAGEELKTLVESLSSSPKAAFFDPRLGGEEPSFFELMTLWFFLCARLEKVDAMVVETGMGGRLDATNILEPLVSVITLIELEHTEYLGSTIAAISAEKAGIIKPGRPLILAKQSAGALPVFKEYAARNKSPLVYFPDRAKVKNVQVSREGTGFDLVLSPPGTNGAKKETETFLNLFVPIPGEIQAMNAGLAVLAAKTAFPGITGSDIRRGLGAFTLPARFERISETPPVIVDGAHTGHSVDACLKTFTALYGTGGVLIFGCAEGKDVLSMAELCVTRFSRIIITTPGTFKKSAPGDIHAAFVKETQKLEAGSPAGRRIGKTSRRAPEIFFIPDTAAAIDKALLLAREHKLPVLGTGSFYLAAEIIKSPALNAGFA